MIANIITEVQKERAEFEFTTHFRDTHYLWLVDNTTSIEQIKKEFESLENIYIADGHHRSASSFLLSGLSLRINSISEDSSIVSISLILVQDKISGNF